MTRHCGKLLTLTSLLLVLTAMLVKAELTLNNEAPSWNSTLRGSGNVQCGPNSLCGYGARCHNMTCVCLSGHGNLTEKAGNPNSIFYCLGEGVIQCGDPLCGYRAKCNTDMDLCGCSFNNGELIQLSDTSPSLWYCVETCISGSNSCPDNTTCMESLDDHKYRCYCSARATLSSTVQCLGNASTRHVQSTADDTIESTSTIKGNATTSPVESAVHDTKESTNQTQANSQTLIIGLSAGIGGGAVLLAVIVFIVVVFIRRRKTKRGVDTCTDNLRRQSHSPHHSSAHNSKAYESVVDPMPDTSGTDSPACPTVIVRTEVSVIGPASRSGAYEDVDKDFGVLYTASKVTAEGDKREADTRGDLYSNNTIPANKAQQAINPISPTSLSGNKAKPKSVKEIYSNHTIPFNKAQQGKKNNKGLSESVPNQYNTLYDLTPANDNRLQPPKTGSGIADQGTADYSVTYSAVGATGSNTQSASTIPRRDLEYNELKLPKA